MSKKSHFRKALEKEISNDPKVDVLIYDKMMYTNL